MLDAAWQQVSERGTADVTIPQIASAAGVTRQLVYLHFGNRAGLLTAMARHRDESSGFADQAAASRRLPPTEGLEHLLRAWCAYVPEIIHVATALEACRWAPATTAARAGNRMEELRETAHRAPPARTPRSSRSRMERRERGRLGVGADPADDLAPLGLQRAGIPATTPSAPSAPFAELVADPPAA